MRRLTLALLSGAYLCLSLIIALSLWRNGGGWGAGVAALVGGLGLAFAFHGLIERALESAGIRGEIANLREAHNRNDEVLERIYIGRRFRNDTERLEKLFELYTKMTKGKAA